MNSDGEFMVFIADDGVAAASSDFAESDWTIEESESDQSEDIEYAE